MRTISIAGTLGRDAEVRQAGDNDVCSFSVAVDDGFGDNKKTLWFDVARWGKGAAGLARVLVKGSRVAVSGDLSMKESNGKTYLQVRANSVTILSTPEGGKRREPDGSRGSSQQRTSSFADELDDSIDIPFLSHDSIW